MACSDSDEQPDSAVATSAAASAVTLGTPTTFGSLGTIATKVTGPQDTDTTSPSPNTVAVQTTPSMGQSQIPEPSLI